MLSGALWSDKILKRAGGDGGANPQCRDGSVTVIAAINDGLGTKSRDVLILEPEPYEEIAGPGRSGQASPANLQQTT